MKVEFSVLWSSRLIYRRAFPGARRPHPHPSTPPSVKAATSGCVSVSVRWVSASISEWTPHSPSMAGAAFSTGGEPPPPPPPSEGFGHFFKKLSCNLHIRTCTDPKCTFHLILINANAGPVTRAAWQASPNPWVPRLHGSRGRSGIGDSSPQLRDVCEEGLCWRPSSRLLVDAAGRQRAVASPHGLPPGKHERKDPAAGGGVARLPCSEGRAEASPRRHLLQTPAPRASRPAPPSLQSWVPKLEAGESDHVPVGVSQPSAPRPGAAGDALP